MRSPWPRCRIPLAVTASVAALSCGEEPVGPPLDTPGSEEPQLGFSPSPCAGLASGIACLVADLDAISHSASSPSPNYSLWVENWIEGTSAGTLLDAVFCTQENDDPLPPPSCGLVVSNSPGLDYDRPTPYQQEAVWSGSMPAGTIEFVGTIPNPEITVTSFQRRRLTPCPVWS